MLAVEVVVARLEMDEVEFGFGITRSLHVARDALGEAIFDGDIALEGMHLDDREASARALSIEKDRLDQFDVEMVSRNVEHRGKFRYHRARYAL